MSMWLRPAVVLSLLVVAGCQDASPHHGDIVPTLDLVRSYAISEDLRIDGIKEDLVPIGDLAVSGDGTIVVAQSQDHKVRFFGSDGQPLEDFGRRGQGPGEFTDVSRLGWLSDTLWVHDSDQRRFTLISPEHELVRTFSASDLPSEETREELDLPVFAMLMPRHLLPGNLVLAKLINPGDETDEIWARVTNSGQLEGVVMRYASGPEDIRYRSEGMNASAGMPYANRPVVAFAQDGSRVIIIRAHIEDEMVGTFDVASISTSADTIWERQYQFEPIEISRETADSIIDARADNLEERFPPLADRYRREAVVPPVYPPIQGAMIGTDGTIWIRVRTRDGENPYLVLNVDGEPMASVALPPMTYFAVVSRDNVWALERDDVGIQSVVRYSVARQ